MDPIVPSGFAALSGSSTHPFSTIGTASKATQISSFGSTTSRANSEVSFMSELHDESIVPIEIQNTSIATPSTSFGLKASGVSAFALPSSSKLQSFGNSAFASGFGTALGGVNKLSSFAAPFGDAKWGDEGGLSKSFAAPMKDEDGEENSECEDDGLGDITKDEETGDIDNRFQQQDGKY